MSLSRRAVLAGASVGIVGLAGCEAGERAGSPGSTSATGGDPPTETPGLDALAFDVRVSRQQSADAPATVEGELTNTGRRSVRFLTGPTVVPRNVGDHRRSVLLYPHTYVGPNETPRQPDGGCWRYTDDDMLVQDVLEQRELAADGAFSETYSLYTVGGVGPCLPAGEYRFEDEVLSQDESRRLTVWIDLAVDDGGTVSADGGTAAGRTSAQVRQ